LASGKVYYAGSASKIETYHLSYEQIFPSAGTFTNNVAIIAEYSRASDFSSCIKFRKDTVFDCDDNCSGNQRIVLGDNAATFYPLNNASDISLSSVLVTISTTKMTTPGSWLST
jgi:hypothetical protein